MIPELTVLALDYYRAPLRYSRLTDASQPLPASFGNLVSAFGSVLSPRNLTATAKALGASPVELQRASRFFLRQVLLARGGSHYRVLGLSPGASDETVRQHYKLLVRFFHPDRSLENAERDAAYAARINEAYRVLKNPRTRERYDKQLALSSGRGPDTPTAKRASSAIVPVRPTRRLAAPRIRFRFRRRRTLMLVVGAGFAVVAVAVIAILYAARQPVLRVNPELADRSSAGPSYLRDRSPGQVSEVRQVRYPDAPTDVPEAPRTGVSAAGGTDGFEELVGNGVDRTWAHSAGDAVSEGKDAPK